ncbi:hypothetical protein D3C81_1553350 [compost metagenome]
MAMATVTPSWPRSARAPASNLACFCVCTFKGEPSRVQIDAYFFADWPERKGKMIRFRMNHQTMRGISTTRGSDKNCFR